MADSNLLYFDHAFPRVDLYSSNTSRTRNTIASLGWTNLEQLILYQFVDSNDRVREPHFQLHSDYVVTTEIPEIIYLETSRISDNGLLLCMYPSGCEKKFKSAADLNRHYRAIHGQSEYQKLFCDYGNCSRAKTRFTRKDHLRDHLRDHHGEDLGQASTRPSHSTNAWKLAQEAWYATRSVHSRWWRCSKCLQRNELHTDNYADCRYCKANCEPERIRLRHEMSGEVQQSLVTQSRSAIRLLNTTTLKLQEFSGGKIPLYAILSHRWEDEEITIRDIQNREHELQADNSEKNWSKIYGCCARAALDGWYWVWIDSCCIDKSSSAELSEAINSMFEYYRAAQVCYAYLSDVQTAHENPSDIGSDFRHSKWFTRGWTLQELIAPERVEFFDVDWKEIGTKLSLKELIKSITQITHLFGYKKASVAQKMSWAAMRETTRFEDQAYCLMGLFDVNMPLLYGEGEKAFYRLQLEILNKSEDDTIFAWEEFSEGGLLATSPKMFKDSQDVVAHRVDMDRSAPTMTSKGLRLELYLFPADLIEVAGGVERRVWAPINCIRKTSKLDDPTSCNVLCLELYRNKIDQIWRREKNFVQLGLKEDDITAMKRYKPGMEHTFIYVPQAILDNFEIGDPPNILLDYRILLNKRYQVTERYGFNDSFIWEDFDEGRMLLRRGFNFFGSGFVRLSSLSHKIILAISRTSYGTGVEFIPDVGQKLGDIRGLSADSQKFIGGDRASHLLPPNRSINVTLKRGTVSGGLYLIVKMSLDKLPDLHWLSSPPEPPHYHWK